MLFNKHKIIKSILEGLDFDVYDDLQIIKKQAKIPDSHIAQRTVDYISSNECIKAIEQLIYKQFKLNCDNSTITLQMEKYFHLYNCENKWNTQLTPGKKSLIVVSGMYNLTSATVNMFKNNADKDILNNKGYLWTNITFNGYITNYLSRKKRYETFKCFLNDIGLTDKNYYNISINESNTSNIQKNLEFNVYITFDNVNQFETFLKLGNQKGEFNFN